MLILAWKQEIDIENLHVVIFENFFELNNKNLLREDQLASACALEYIDLLDLKIETGKINKLIRIAVENSGNKYDILELCSIAYLNIGNIKSAEVLLRQLVNEEYNTILNAQILSNIYVSDFIYKNNPEIAKSDYELLQTRVMPEYLFPFPKTDVFEIEKLNNDFFEKQRKTLIEKYHLVLNEYIKKYTIKYNKSFPIPNNSKEHSDSYFLDGESERAKRIEDLDAVLNSHRRKYDYCERLKDDMFVYNIFQVLNEMYNEVIKLSIIEDIEFLEIILTSGIVKSKETLNKILDAVSNNKNEVINLELLSELSFRDIIYDFFKELNNQMIEGIKKIHNMNEVAKIESELGRFCETQGISSPEKLYRKNHKIYFKPFSEKIFSPKILGIDYAEIEKENQIKRKCKEIVEQYKEKIILLDKASVLIESTDDFELYFRKISNDELKDWKKSTFAIVDAKGALDVDLLLSTKGIVVAKCNIFTEVVLYNDVRLEDEALICEGYDSNILGDVLQGIAIPYNLLRKKEKNNTISKTSFKYKNKNVNLFELYNLAKELDNQIPKSNVPNEGDEKSTNYARDYYDFLNS